MVSSRALLLLIAALALPVFVGCGDDSGSKEEETEEDKGSTKDDDDDKGGEKTDARVSSRMDSSVKGDAGSDGEGDGATSGDGEDAGETKVDSGSAAQDAGGETDAKVDGIDAAADAGKDAKADEEDEDAGDEEEVDAGQDAGDAGQDAGKDAGQPDTGSEDEEFTEADCTKADGDVKDSDESCAANETKYELKGDKICCAPKEVPAPGGACSVEVACPNGQFCDYSKSNGGAGCTDAKKAGKCRAVPDQQCTGIAIEAGCGCDKLPHTTCDGWQKSIPVEIGDPTCLFNPGTP